MVRKIIKINEEKCNGCGACAAACHEGAIEIIDGKARLTREDYCDGLGDCLSQCPTDAISFEEREAPAYDEAAVRAAKREKLAEGNIPHSGCPGIQPRQIERNEADNSSTYTAPARSQLGQWPCQIKLASVNAPYFNGAKLLIAADCTAYAYANIHNDYMKRKITLIGCPKLDAVDYSGKLTDIIKNNDINRSMERLLVNGRGVVTLFLAILNSVDTAPLYLLEAFCCPCHSVIVRSALSAYQQFRGA